MRNRIEIRRTLLLARECSDSFSSSSLCLRSFVLSIFLILRLYAYERGVTVFSIFALLFDLRHVWSTAASVSTGPLDRKRHAEISDGVRRSTGNVSKQERRISSSLMKWGVGALFAGTVAAAFLEATHLSNQANA